MANTGPQPVHRPKNPEPSQKPVKVVFWTAVWMSLAIGALAGVSVLDDVRGQPLFDNGILGQAITAIGIFAAAIGPSYIQQRRDTQQIKHEVKNDHPKNLRVENDQRFHVTSNSLMTLLEEVKNTQKMIANNNRKLDAFDRKFDNKVDILRQEQQQVQHENVARIRSLERGLIAFLLGDPMPIKKEGSDD